MERTTSRIPAEVYVRRTRKRVILSPLNQPDYQINHIADEAPNVVRRLSFNVVFLKKS